MSRYKDLGVDVSKKGIESFTTGIDNLVPGAFCVVHRDSYNPKLGMVVHTDSAGSKPIQAYLMYREMGEAKWFRGLAQDALAMNINDIVCVGADPVSFVDYVAFNTLVIERVKLLDALAQGFIDSKERLKKEDVSIAFAGGETADLPDLLRTLDVCVTIVGRVALNKVITGGSIKPGDIIVGMRSGGRSRLDNGDNSGIMSNGHTLARSCLLKPEYLEKYPELSHPGRGRFTGRYHIEDKIDEIDSTVGEALLSPTRFYAPLALKMLKSLGSGIHAFVHNTGGGQTKILRLGKGIKYVKDTLPEPDPIFNLIQREGQINMKEMYQDFNMGIGFEALVAPSNVEEVIKISESFGVEAMTIGRCERVLGENELRINIQGKTVTYSQ